MCCLDVIGMNIVLYSCPLSNMRSVWIFERYVEMLSADTQRKVYFRMGHYEWKTDNLILFMTIEADDGDGIGI